MFPPLFLNVIGSWDLVLFLFVGLYVAAAVLRLIAAPREKKCFTEQRVPDTFHEKHRVDGIILGSPDIFDERHRIAKTGYHPER